MKYFILSLAIAASQLAFAAESELKVGIKGMVCAFCAQGIEKKFKAQKEVDNVQVVRITICPLPYSKAHHRSLFLFQFSSSSMLLTVR